MQIDETMLARLMAAAQQGDRDAYRTLLENCRRWLDRYYAGKIAADRRDDLVQETLMSLHAKRASYDPRRPFLPWLAAIARYRWIDHLRRHYRTKEDTLPESLSVESEEPAIAARLGLDRLLALIPDGQALAIRLVKIEGLTIKEASARTGQSESLVKVNIHRGMKRMAAAIEEG